MNRNGRFNKIGYSVAVGGGITLVSYVLWFFYYPKIYGYLFPYGQYFDHFLLILALFSCFYLVNHFVKSDSVIFYLLTILPLLFLVPVKNNRVNKLYAYWLDEQQAKREESQRITEKEAVEAFQILGLNHETIDDNNDDLLDRLKLTVEISSKAQGNFIVSALLGENLPSDENHPEFFHDFAKKQKETTLNSGKSTLSFEFPSKDIFTAYGSSKFSFKIEISFEPEGSDLYYYSQLGLINTARVFPLPYTRFDFLDKPIFADRSYYVFQETPVKDYLEFRTYVTAKRSLYKMEGSVYTRNGEFLGRFISQPYFIQSTLNQKNSAEIILKIPGSLIYRQGKDQQYTLKEVKIFDVCHEEIYLDVGGVTNSNLVGYEEFNLKITTVESTDELIQCEEL